MPSFKGVTRVEIAIMNNAYWDDAFQFGVQGDTTWSFTGKSFLLDLKQLTTSPSPSLSLSSAGGSIVVDDAVNRILHVYVSDHAIRNALQVVTDPPSKNSDGSTVGVYAYDLIMVDNVTGERDTLMAGCVTVQQGVTIED